MSSINKQMIDNNRGDGEQKERKKGMSAESIESTPKIISGKILEKYQSNSFVI